MLNISIVTIGDEIRIGQIVNSNAAWIANEITKIGANISNHITIGDDFQLMEKVLNEQIEKNDFVITTGGLGPTHDDITKPVLLKLFDDELIFHQPTFDNIYEQFKIRQREISDRNRLQAYVPSKSTPLPNAIGTAPGLMYHFNDKYLFVLPGVPAEMKYIITHSILPLISKVISEKSDNVTLYKTLNLAGIFESNLADEIGIVDEFLNGSTLAFLPGYKGIRLRIGTVKENFQEAEKEINRIKDILYKKIGQYIFAEDDTDLNLEISKILKNKNWTLSVAESCTGGGLGAEITKIPGSSQYFLGGIVAYSNEVKVRQLNVRPITVSRFGAVSQETAVEMAKNCRKKFESDFAISITGVAGPDGGTPDKPVGTVWIGISDKKATKAYNFLFGNDRLVNQERAINSALYKLYQLIRKKHS